MAKQGLTCNEDCFHCIYPDCVMDILPSQKKAQKKYRQKRKKKSYEKVNTDFSSVSDGK